MLAFAYVRIRVSMTGSYFRGDILTQFLPYYTALTDRIKDGDLPGWNPTLFSGMPLAGDPISGWGYLPVIGSFLLFNPLTAYKLSVLFHIGAATIATYLFARSLRMGPVGAAAAGIAFLLSPHYHYSQCCTARMQLGPWIPIGLLSIEWALRSERAWVRMLCWVSTGFVIWQMIAGYFGKGMYYGVLLLGAYLAYRTLIDPPTPQADWLARLANVVLNSAMVLGFGAGFSAMVLLPRLDFLNNANLKGGTYEVVAPGAVDPPAWSAGRALSIIFDPARPTYFIGAATVALAFAGVVLAGRRFAAPFFAIFSLAVVILTMRTTPLHHLMYLLPRFKVIHEHEPQRILVVLNIGPAMLAGAAITALEQRLLSLRKMIAAAAASVIGALLITLIVRWDDRSLNSALIKASVLIAAILLAATLIAPALTGKARARMPLALSVVLVLVLLFNLDRGRLRAATEDGWKTESPNELALAYSDQEGTGGAGAFLRERLEVEGPFRYFGYNSAFLSLEDDAMKDNYRSQWPDILAADLLLDNRALALGLQDIQGYNPVQEMNYLTFINALNGQIQEYHETNILPSGLTSPLLPLLNVRYVIIPLEASGADFDLLTSKYSEVYRDGSVRILEVTDSLPRAWTVHEAQQLAEDAVLPTLASGSVNPGTTALVSEQPPALAPLPAGATDQVTIATYEADQIALTATMASDGLVMLSEVYDPGWKATVDGKSVPIYEADGLLRAIPVPAGTHTIELSYAPSSIRNGIVLSALTWVLAIAAVLLLAWKKPEEWLQMPGLRRARPLLSRLGFAGVAR